MQIPGEVYNQHDHQAPGTDQALQLSGSWCWGAQGLGSRALPMSLLGGRTITRGETSRKDASR